MLHGVLILVNRGAVNATLFYDLIFANSCVFCFEVVTDEKLQNTIICLEEGWLVL